ncbi:MAG: hypothetical protein GY859_14410 [Desulfobacterales bacterium]|nr:hypothetical protein [Desulfobacterales bacterium]
MDQNRFLIGEAEAMVSEFFQYYDPDEDRESLLTRLVQNAPGAYTPSFYEPAYSRDGTLSWSLEHLIHLDTYRFSLYT